MDLQDSIDLTDGKCVIDVSTFNTYNAIFNVTSENNKLIATEGLLYWKVIPLPPGANEKEQNNDEISRQLQQEAEALGEAPVVLEANTATIHSVIYRKFGLKIDFPQPSTLRDLLGFESVVLADSYNYSKNKVDIMGIY